MGEGAFPDAAPQVRIRCVRLQSSRLYFPCPAFTSGKCMQYVMRRVHHVVELRSHADLQRSNVKYKVNRHNLQPA